LARADNAQARVSPQWIDLRSTLEKILSYYELLAEERGIRLALEVRSDSGGRARAWADEMMLNRAARNLLSTPLPPAPQHSHGPQDRTGPGGARARPDGPAEVEVANPGAGIGREHLPRIFDRFYRPSSSREGSAAGSGLGLAIVKSIAELHGGRVGVRSEPGLETAFTLSLPAAGRTQARTAFFSR